MTTEGDILYRFKRLTTERRKVTTQFANLRRQLDDKNNKVETALMQLEQEILSKVNRHRQAMNSWRTESNQAITKLETISALQERFTEELEALYSRLSAEERHSIGEELEDLRAQLADIYEAEIVDPNFNKASTISIFEGILFAIENWAQDGQSAPDFTLACQAVLFRSIYERVMSGDEELILESVPSSAIEVVKRGREYISSIREKYSAAITDPSIWPVVIGEIHKWWLQDALPLLYGETTQSAMGIHYVSLTDIITWRDQPAARALDFPLIFDAYDLMDRYSDQIRETTGLPEFTRQTIDTRLEVN